MHVTLRVAAVLAAVVALAAAARPASAAIKVWAGTSGNWTTAANWSPNGAPIGGDDVFLTSGDATNRTVTYNATGQILHVYRTVRTDSTGAGLMTLQQIDPNTDLNADFLYVGNQARGTYDLFAGRGVFGQTEVHAQGVLSIRAGAQVISGSLLQTGGTVSATGSLDVTGSYTFNGGSASGHVSAGTFISNGGAFGAGVTALNRLVLGGNGNGTFGGTVVNHGPLSLPAGRTIATGGSLGHVGASFTQMGNLSVGTESFVHSGGSWSQLGGTHVTRNLSIAAAGPGSFSLGAGGVLNATGVDIALGGDGTYTQTGGVASFSGTFIRGPIQLQPGRMYWNVGGGTMTHTGNFVVGLADAPSGTFIQSGGFVQLRSLHVNVNAATTAAAHLSGGTFIVDMNSTNHGTFNQTGGNALFKEHLDGAGDVSVTGSGALAVKRLRQLSLFVGGDGIADLDPDLPGPAEPQTHRLRSLAFEQAGNTVRGRVDLGDDLLVVDYSGASPHASLRQYLASGYAGGAWTGSGIMSSTAAGNMSQTTALGLAEASDVLGADGGVFGNLAVDGTSVLIRYTRYGDANLDGAVTLQDFNRLAGNFGGSGKSWAQADFNYDGIVNLQDFNRLAANFGLSATGPGVTPEDWAALAVAVPEPAGMSSAIAVLAMLVRRRRRR